MSAILAASSAAGAASGGGGIIMGAIGMRRARKNAKRQARLHRQIGEANVEELKREAIDVVRLGREQTRQHYWNASLIQGENYASVSAAGVNADFGSAAAIAAQNATQMRADADVLVAETASAVRAIGHEIKTTQLGAELGVTNAQTQGAAARLRFAGQITRSGAQGISGALGVYSEFKGD